MDDRSEGQHEARAGSRWLWPWLLSLGGGAAYGLVARLADGEPGTGQAARQVYWVMTWSFLAIVPGVMGLLAVRALEKPSVLAAIFLPWLPCLVSIAIAFAIGAEGTICIVLSLPMMLMFSSLGGLVMRGLPRRHKNTAMLSALALPFVTGAIEGRLTSPHSLRTVRTEIAIAAAPEVVWRHIERVAAIQPSELEPSLASSLGFPSPVEATLDREGLGGVRHATFAGGVLFIETITEWEEPRRLSFAIDAQTETIPPETLDEHVTIGGPYFDVLQGTYEIEPRGSGCVLHLESRLRVSTTFNLYAGPWADLLMASIQEQILRVVKKRCEASVR